MPLRAFPSKPQGRIQGPSRLPPHLEIPKSVQERVEREGLVPAVRSSGR